MVLFANSVVEQQLKKRLFIKSSKYKPRAGMVIFRDGLEPRVLLIKEKGGGKRWGFPKGGVEYRCQQCGLLVRREEYCRMSRRPCPKMAVIASSVPDEGSSSEDSLSDSPSPATLTPDSSSPDSPANLKGHDLKEETVWECAEREVLEETGWSVAETDEVLLTRRVGNCIYLLVRSEKQNVVRICPNEILDFRWVSLGEINREVRKDPFKFNYGARAIIPTLIRYLRGYED